MQKYVSKTSLIRQLTSVLINRNVIKANNRILTDQCPQREKIRIYQRLEPCIIYRFGSITLKGIEGKRSFDSKCRKKRKKEKLIEFILLSIDNSKILDAHVHVSSRPSLEQRGGRGGRGWKRERKRETIAGGKQHSRTVAVKMKSRQ